MSLASLFLHTLPRLRLFGWGAARDAVALQRAKIGIQGYVESPPYNTLAYQGTMKSNANATDFENVRQLILKRGLYFPPGVMAVVGDFTVENREMAAGDFVLQRVNALPFSLSISLAEVLTVDRIACATVTSSKSKRIMRLVLQTTSYHDEVGEHEIIVELHHESKILSYSALSKSVIILPWPLNKYGMYLQRIAHEKAKKFMESCCGLSSPTSTEPDPK